MRLNYIVQLLEEYKKMIKKDFLIDDTINSAAQFNLVIGIEIIVDTGNHILNEGYQIHSKEYKEVIKNLGEYDIVPRNFALENIEMAKFRNRIIHDYDDVDMKQVYDNLQKAPDAFRQFAKYYSDFLEKN